MEIIVIDASVILKFVLRDDEDRREKALKILYGWLEGKYNIILPSLWLFEVGNILSKREPTHAGEILKRLLEYEYTEARITESLINIVLKLVREKGVTFYDAVYHAIAIQEKGRFVTADKDYFERAKDRGHIQLLDQ